MSKLSASSSLKPDCLGGRGRRDRCSVPYVSIRQHNEVLVEADDDSDTD